MTAMTKMNGQALTALTVGQVAEQFDVTVRTLHHPLTSASTCVVSAKRSCPGLTR